MVFGGGLGPPRWSLRFFGGLGCFLLVSWGVLGCFGGRLGEVMGGYSGVLGCLVLVSVRLT